MRLPNTIPEARTDHTFVRYKKRFYVYGGRDEVQIFKDIVDIVNREFLTEQNKAYIKEHNKIEYNNLKYISMITFAGNCIIIKKMTENEYKKYGNRKYRFEKNL
jgi:hypothetical protein